MLYEVYILCLCFMADTAEHERRESEGERENNNYECTVLETEEI